jgi:hypothetical protein
MLRKVVLPEPDGPVTATNSPSRTCSVEVAQRVGFDQWVR